MNTFLKYTIILAVLAGLFVLGFMFLRTKEDENTENKAASNDPLNRNVVRDLSPYKTSLPANQAEFWRMVNQAPLQTVLYGSGLDMATIRNADGLALYQLLLANMFPNFLRKIAPCAEEGLSNPRIAVNTLWCLMRQIGNFFIGCSIIVEGVGDRRIPYPGAPQPSNFMTYDECESDFQKTRDSFTYLELLLVVMFLAIIMLESGATRISSIMEYYPREINENRELVKESEVIFYSPQLVQLVNQLRGVLSIASNRQVEPLPEVEPGKILPGHVWDTLIMILVSLLRFKSPNYEVCTCGTEEQQTFMDFCLLNLNETTIREMDEKGALFK
jgi:hypothetical protein